MEPDPPLLTSHLHSALPHDCDTKSRKLHRREHRSENPPLFTDKKCSKERDHEMENEKQRRQAHRDAREASCRKRTLAMLYCPSSSSLESSLVLAANTIPMDSISEDDEKWGEGYRSRGSTNSSLGKGFQTEDGPSGERKRSWNLVQYWRGSDGVKGDKLGGGSRRVSWP